MTTITTQYKIVAGVTGLNAVSQLKRELDNVSTGAEKMRRFLIQGGRELVGLAGSLAAAFGGAKTLAAADEMNRLRARVQLVTRSVQESRDAWKGLTDMALRTGASAESLVAVYQRLSYVRDEIRASNAEMLQFTDTVSKLGVLSGASADAMKFGLTQLGQGLSSQYLRAEEFNSIMENIPAIGKAIADEFGVSTGALGMMVREGTVLSEDVFSALLNQSAKVREQFESYPASISQAKAQLEIAFGIASQGLDEATGATRLWIGTLNIATNAVMGLGKVFEGIAATVEAAFAAVTGTVMMTVMKLTNAILAGINSVIETLNYLPGVNIGTMGKFDTAAFGDAMFSDIGGNLSKASKAFSGAAPAFLGQGRGAALGETTTRPLKQDYAKMASSLSDKGSKEADKAAKEAAKAAAALQKLQAEFLLSAMAADRAFGAQARDDLREYAKAAGDVGASIADTITNGFKKAEDALVEFTKTGKLNFRDFASSVIEDLIRMQVRSSITGPLASWMSGLFQPSLPGVMAQSANAGGMFGTMVKSIGATMGFADGGSFKVGGTGGTDSQLVAFRASPDERVTITRPDQERGAGNVNVSVTVNMANGSTNMQADGKQAQALGAMMASVAKSTIMRETMPGGILAGRGV